MHRIPGAPQQPAGVTKIARGPYSMVFPDGVRPDSERALQVLNAIAGAIRVPGLPSALLDGLPIMVSLATRTNPDVDAVTYADQRLIALPFQRWNKWPSAKLERVIRHEVAHVALAAHFGTDRMPRWLSEGFAEWATGPISCEDETLLRLDLLSRGRAPMLRVVSDSPTLGWTRLQYVYLAVFVGFLDAGNAVSNGRLLSAVRSEGLQGAMVKVYGAGLDTLEVRWWRSGLKQYRGELPAQLRCAL